MPKAKKKAPVVEKKQSTLAAPKKKFVANAKNHTQFLMIVVLFAAVSMYGIISLFMSTNDYLKNQYSASVLGAGRHTEETDKEVVEGEVVVTEEGAAGARVFTDVLDENVNAQAIETLYYQGVIKGYSDGTFRPDVTISRAEFWALITNAIDADFAHMRLANCFTDVGEEWFATFVCYAKDRGWISGFEDGSYKPNQPVTRGEVVKMTLNAFGYETPTDLPAVDPFTDVKRGDWVAPYAVFARDNGLVADTETFYPLYNMTRADVAALIYVVMQDLEMIEERD